MHCRGWWGGSGGGVGGGVATLATGSRRPPSIVTNDIVIRLCYVSCHVSPNLECRSTCS